MFTLAVILGTILFIVLNRVIDITYFGCGAILTAWAGCVIVFYTIFQMM